MNIQDRAKFYNEKFPKYPPLAFTDRWLYGMWVLGNDYQSKTGYYGEYPPMYLRRVLSMFPEVQENEILHLFSGSVTEPGIKFDIRKLDGVDVVGDAEQLSTYFPDYMRFTLILADPPYSDEDAYHYGTKMVNRNKVIAECIKVLKPKGHICWLDQVLPMYSSDELLLVGTIGVVRSTNHRFRVLSIFQKIGKDSP